MTAGSKHDAAIAAYVDAAAALLQLPLCAEERKTVIVQFERLAAMAELLAEHPLRFADEPAPVFHPQRLP